MKTKKQKAIALRLQGKSYGEIMKALNISSKGTLSCWLSAVRLPKRAKQQLQRTIVKSVGKGLVRFNEKRTKKIRRENQLALKKSIESVRPLSRTVLTLIGASLYWGEGYKRQSEYRTPQISFGNTDPYMIKIFMRFTREILQIPEYKIHIKVQIHPRMPADEAIHFWSKVTHVPESNMTISRQTSRASKGIRPINIQPHGTAEIRVSSRKDFFRIMGWIRGIAKQGSKDMKT